MKKNNINQQPGYFDKYIELSADIELADALGESLHALQTLDLNLLKTLGTKTYAPGKWSVKDILQHITDTERVFCYRILLFARQDQTLTASYDENVYAENAGANNRDITDIVEELILVRKATQALFKSFDDKTLLQKGISWKYEMSVLAMGFTLVGHQKHHFDFMKKNYYALAQKA
jgi:hypothetical protein